MLNETKVFETTIAGRQLKVELGRVAHLTNGACLISYGETVVLTTAVASRKAKEGIDFFPLTVEYEEKMYSVGKIPGGFIKREGRPSEKATLTARLIDRPIRPLFPTGFKNEVQVVSSVMSIEQDCAPDITAMIGSSIALSISDIPFDGPIAAVNVGYVDGKYIINPTVAERELSSINLIVAGTEDAVVMVEAGIDILPEDVVLGAIMYGHDQIKEICSFINKIVAEVGKTKFTFDISQVDTEYADKITAFLTTPMDKAVRINDKHDRNIALEDLKEALVNSFLEEYPDTKGFLSTMFKQVEKDIVRTMISLEGVRPDGRGIRDVRHITCEVGVLPRTHGSGMFQRGLTQALSITTLGALGEAQRIDGIGLEENKRYMHHYNFPPYSVGETGFMRVNRRAVGHGALGERALMPVLPSEDDFPYAIRVVSEILTCNGSSSQASICGSTLSLLDAGVPIKAPVAGIAMGLIQEKGKISILSDIQGMEDALGDMDFKVAGTAEGLTALQMDIKVDGLSKEILENALSQANEGRLHILSKMNEVINTPREEMSEFAPRVFSVQVKPEKIREIIGPGGKTITRITKDHNVKIDIDDTGRVLITAADGIGGKNALKEVELIIREVEVGEIYDGKIVRITTFGCFVELIPGKDGLCHISQLTNERLKKVEDKFKEGEIIRVKVTEIDGQGRVNLSRKVLLSEDEN
ncbi:MAG: polyribonucleotide nucleotidyltransferase [Acidaminobacteraceae bacterium]